MGPESPFFRDKVEKKQKSPVHRHENCHMTIESGVNSFIDEEEIELQSVENSESSSRYVNTHLN